MKGTLPRSRVFFLPILSAAAPTMNGPKDAPKGKRDPIHPASLTETTSLRGDSDKFCSFGRTGDVHPRVIPHVKAAKFPEKKIFFQVVSNHKVDGAIVLE